MKPFNQNNVPIPEKNDSFRGIEDVFLKNFKEKYSFLSKEEEYKLSFIFNQQLNTDELIDFIGDLLNHYINYPFEVFDDKGYYLFWCFFVVAVSQIIEVDALTKEKYNYKVSSAEERIKRYITSDDEIKQLYCLNKYRAARNYVFSEFYRNLIILLNKYHFDTTLLQKDISNLSFEMLGSKIDYEDYNLYESLIRYSISMIPGIKKYYKEEDLNKVLVSILDAKGSYIDENGNYDLTELERFLNKIVSVKTNKENKNKLERSNTIRKQIEDVINGDKDNYPIDMQQEFIQSVSVVFPSSYEEYCENKRKFEEEQLINYVAEQISSSLDLFNYYFEKYELAGNRKNIVDVNRYIANIAKKLYDAQCSDPSLNFIQKYIRLVLKLINKNIPADSYDIVDIMLSERKELLPIEEILNELKGFGVDIIEPLN